MDPKPRPCFNTGFLDEFANCQRIVDQINRSSIQQGGDCPVQYTILASRIPRVYSMGGDLELFRSLILAKDREGLRQYARLCIDLIHLMSRNHHLPMTTISLVQGDALGGGFEAALSCSVVVAEKGAQFGLPEILFGLFPGMGAYSFLSRRLGAARAERLVTSGTVYSAAEMHEIGVVDVLADDGDGEKAVHEFIAGHRRRRNALQALFSVRQRVHGVPYQELCDVADLWVDTALSLGPRDIRVMDRLLKAQDRAHAEAPAPAKAEDRSGI